MFKKIKMTLLSFSALFMFAIPLAAGGIATAAISQTDLNSNLCSGSSGDLTNGSGGTCDDGSSKVNSLISTIVNVISLVVGVIAVIMIIIGGLRYVTSGGKQESVTGAKNTILYALVGLVIVALAQIIVHFVLNKTSTATAG